jgi:hypothetical protein
MHTKNDEIEQEYREYESELSDGYSEYGYSEDEYSDGSESSPRRRKRRPSPPIVVKDPKEICEELCSEYRFLVNYGYFEVSIFKVEIDEHLKSNGFSPT